MMDKKNKPLKVHPGYLLNNNPKIERQIERYKINKDFYSNNVNDADIDPKTNFDPEMV